MDGAACPDDEHFRNVSVADERDLGVGRGEVLGRCVFGIDVVERPWVRKVAVGERGASGFGGWRQTLEPCNVVGGKRAFVACDRFACEVDEICCVESSCDRGVMVAAEHEIRDRAYGGDGLGGQRTVTDRVAEAYEFFRTAASRVGDDLSQRRRIGVYVGEDSVSHCLRIIP